MTVLQDIQQLNVGNIITLYELDLTGCIGKFGQTTTDKFTWCDGVNELGNDIMFDGITYSRYPIQATGFDKMGNGSIPRPKLSVANIGGIIGALARDYNDLIGAKLTRVRTFARYLDSENFLEPNLLADPTQILDKEIWTIDRKSNENFLFMEWELTAPFDLQGVKIPRRQCVQNMCNWKYRSAECSYTGTNYFDVKDNQVLEPSKDVCGKRLSSCKLRFGTIAVLPYGGFPAVGI